MNWKKSLRFIFRSTLVSLAVAALLGVAAFLPGSVEGNYNNFWVSSCGCDSKTIMHLRADKWVTYRTGHDDADLHGRYMTRKDGVVEIYRHPFDEGKMERLVMKAYPRLFITKFVTEESESVYWRWKLPAIGVIGEAIRKHEVHMTVWPPKGRMRRTVYGPDLKLRRHEANVGPGKWAAVPAGAPLSGAAVDWRPFTIFEASRSKREILPGAVEQEFRQEDLAAASLTIYTAGRRLENVGVSKTGFDAALRAAADYDGSMDPFFQRYVELIIRFEKRHYLVMYEDHPDNAEAAKGRRFVITPLVSLDSDDKVFVLAPGDGGTSYDKVMLGIFKEVTASLRRASK